MEILLFSLGTRETFGINVLKVREIMQTPEVTRAPHVPPGVAGVISLRGNIIPVISLEAFVNEGAPCSNRTMMVTEFNRRTQGFLLHEVDRIVQVGWDQVKALDGVLARAGGLITAVAELPGGALVSLPDVEQILAGVFGETAIPELERIGCDGARVFFVDDSSVARKEIALVLEKLGIDHLQARNGREAWEKLHALADRSQAEGGALRERLHLILTDAEMPEMDGYALTRCIKGDGRFAGIPVVMHSSLSSAANRAMGKSVGVDAYVAKFEPRVLGDTLRPLVGAALAH